MALIRIFDIKSRPPKLVLNLLDDRVLRQIIHERSAWHRTDLVPYVTGGLTVARERFCARMEALPVILPEAHEWARMWIGEQLARGADVHLFIPYAYCEVER